jgi:hypothetical protein
LLILVATAALFALAGRWVPPALRERADAFVARPAMPWLAGAITAAILLTFWGSLSGPGVFHDERAYLVQARLLAGFSWTAATPPLPEFWEMAHVFVDPAIFAKYPPGHAPLLVPGIWLGMPGLVPILLTGLTGGLVLALARRVIGAWGAVASWALWTSSPFVLVWQGSYFSEVTTAALWLIALLLLLEWTRLERGWMLVAIVATVGWLGITRPVTGIALGIPIAAVVLRTAWRRHALAGWKPALLVGALVVAFVPWWSWRTIGSVTTMPYAHYSTVYFPWDMPGFERDTSPPLRWLPPDLEHLGASTKVNYEGHTAANAPRNLARRTQYVVLSGFPFGTHHLAFLVPVGLLALSAPVALVLGASFLLLMVSYLVMPHDLTWTIYYLEVFALPGFLAVAAIGLLARRRRGEVPRWAALAIVAFVAVRSIPALPLNRVAEDRHANRILVFEALVDRLPEERVVVFIRPRPSIQPHFTLHDILGEPATTPRWLVRDLGPERNAQLIARADGRTPYLYDEARVEFVRLAPDGSSMGVIDPLAGPDAAGPAAPR